MSNTKFQFKRTTVSGRLPNTTNSANTSYIDAGEFAVNLTDGKIVSSNGTVTFEVGANLSSLNLGGSLTANGSNGSSGQVLTSNSSGVYWSTISAGGSVNSAAQYTWTNTQTFSANVTISSGQLLVTNANPSGNAVSGSVLITGGLGVANNIYTGGRVGFSNATNQSVVYQYYNASNNSLDTVFG